MDFNTIVTVGPAIFDSDKLNKIDEQGNCIYRINGAHVDVEEALRHIGQVREALPQARIMLDLPGNKIRTNNLSEPIRLIKGEHFFLYSYQVNYPHFYEHIKVGDIVLANDSIFTFKVIEKDKDKLKLLSYSDGLLSSNKGLHAMGIYRDIPFIFDKDRDLIKLACSAGVDYLSVSYVRRSDDIRAVKNIMTQKDIHLIAKVETLEAVKNLEGILEEAESILVDRGDLSTETGMIDLAATQEIIVKAGLRAGRNVYLATQFLKNMETYPVPLIAEIMDLYKTINSGITGIQLSEETAIGRYPIESVKLIFDIYKNIKVKQRIQPATDRGAPWLSGL